MCLMSHCLIVSLWKSDILHIEITRSVCPSFVEISLVNDYPKSTWSIDLQYGLNVRMGAMCA